VTLNDIAKPFVNTSTWTSSDNPTTKWKQNRYAKRTHIHSRTTIKPMHFTSCAFYSITYQNKCHLPANCANYVQDFYCFTFQDRQPQREKDPGSFEFGVWCIYAAKFSPWMLLLSNTNIFWQIVKAVLVVNNFHGCYGTVLDWTLNTRHTIRYKNHSIKRCSCK
jgi:hypothetical protein